MTLDRWLMFSLIVGGVIVLLWLIYWVYRAKLLEREERRLMIERGMTPPYARASRNFAIRNASC